MFLFLYHPTTSITSAYPHTVTLSGARAVWMRAWAGGTADTVGSMTSASGRGEQPRPTARRPSSLTWAFPERNSSGASSGRDFAGEEALLGLEPPRESA